MASRILSLPIKEPIDVGTDVRVYYKSAGAFRDALAICELDRRAVIAVLAELIEGLWRNEFAPVILETIDLRIIMGCIK